jgi:hypothetical protein
VKGAETARKGCGDVEGPKRVRLEEESRKAKPRRRGADPRRKVRGEPNAGVRSQIPRLDFVVHRGPEEVPEERPGLQRRRPPRDDQGQGVKKKFFSFHEDSASFQTDRFFFFGFELSFCW